MKNRKIELGAAAFMMAAAPIATAAETDGTASAARWADTEILVTGTRIATPAARGLEPTVTTARAYLLERNLTNVADALNEIPGYRGADTPDGVQASYGQGVNFVNAYRIGSNRTLTLVNGRRAVSSNVPTIFGQAAPGTQVDLNMIPAILVERVDRVAIGGAPVHGSDAIAGTVNVILRNDIRGPELRAISGITERGDNFRYNVSGAWGVELGGGRGHLTMAASHDGVRGLRQNARRFYRDNIGEVPNSGPPSAAGADGRLNPGIANDSGPNDGRPATILARDVTVPFLTEGGLIFSGPLARRFRFDTQGNLVPFAGGNAFPPYASGGDGMRLNDYGQITGDLERTSGSLLGHYDIGGNLRLFWEAHLARSRADELVDQPNYNAVLFSGVSGPLLFPVTNPFLTDQARELLAANGYRSFLLSRANADLGDPTGYAKSAMYRGVGGLAGDMKIGSRAFTFEVSASYGRTDFTDHDQQIDQQRFVNAINAKRDAQGRIVCDPQPLLAVGGSPVADPRCRPLNLFGAGAPSAEALDYVIADVRAQSRLEQWVVNGHIGGSPFLLFGNEVQLAIGFEHRTEKARFTPDAFQQQGLGRSVATPPVSGQFDLDEIFGEVLFPLIAPDSGGPIHRLDLFARGRRTHNSVNGAFTSWAAGGRLEPVRGLQMRGNFTRSFRAPAIVELFSPLGTSRESVPDLCSTANRNTGPDPATRARNCAAFLAAYPGATPLLASIATVPALSGGNPDLANERADSFTFGMMLQPGFAPGLTVTADYLDIDIRDPIAFLSVAQIASACFDNPAFDLSDPMHGNAFCAAIGRDAQGQVVADPLNPAVRTGFINGRRIAFSGIEGAIAYTAGMERLGLKGLFTLGADVFYVRRRVQDLTGVNPIRTDGLIGDPKVQAQLRLGYADRDWGTSIHFNYTGTQLFSRFDRGGSPNDARELDRLDDFVTIDASASVEPVKDLRMSLAVTNLTDRKGQRYFGALLPASINDALGRRFSLSISRTF